MSVTSVETAPLLREFLYADDGASDAVLDVLVRDEALPVIRAIVGSRFDRDEHDAEDVCNDVALQITRRLRAARHAGEREPIASFRAYVATATYRACDAVLREKYPERHRLYNRVRYVLSHHRAFFLHGTLCGFARDEGLAAKPAPHAPEGLRSDDVRGERLVATLTTVFDASGGPLEVDAVVSLLAPAVDAPKTAGDTADDVPDGAIETGVLLAQKAQLQQLWIEVCLLPRPQRVALLFNLRDANGEELLSVLPIIGVAGLGDIAQVVEIDEREFRAIADGLPWGDGRIAELLGVTRQQVINLRKAARARLARRLRK